MNLTSFSSVAISGAAMLMQYYAATGANAGASLNAAALQQGGIGLVMSVLMVMAPPMAAMFFGGTLGQFVANSSFGNVGRNSTGQVSDTVMPTQRYGGGGGYRDRPGAGAEREEPGLRRS